MYIRRKVKKFILLLCILLAVYLIFYNRTPSSMKALPDKWTRGGACFISSNTSDRDTRASVRQWSSHFRNLIKIQKPQLYNVNSTQNCDRQNFYSDMENNLLRVLSYSVSRDVPCLQKSKYIDRLDKNTFETSPVATPVIVTAASSNHYLEAQALFRSIDDSLRKLYPDIRVILFDIGLTEQQKNITKKYCQCEVRNFEFDKFPAHVGIVQAYAWKPLILYQLLQEYNFVMWADVSIRFRGIKKAWEDLFNRTKQTGIQLQGNPRWKVNKQTKPDTFTFLDEPECLFGYTELESGWILLWKNAFTMNAVLRPWVGCALVENCLTHPYPTYLRSCSRDLWKFLLSSRCHRFDQSVLNIILIRIFNVHRRLIEFDISDLGSIERGDIAHYFPV